MKYNDNGTIKQITVKAGDTLPVGTEVDVPDGTTIPAGWEEVDDWKFLDSKTGNTPISLSNTNYKELYIRILMKASASDAGISEEFYIIKDILTATEMSFRKGYYQSSSINGYAYLNVSLASATLNFALRNNADATEYSIIEVYYR